MSSDNEDEDLELLRSAALASLRRKPSQPQHPEDDDVDTLRHKALTSRNNFETVVKTRNKFESSLDQPDSESDSENDDNHNPSASSDNETSNSNSSSSSDDEAKETPSTKDAGHLMVRKDEDDLLSAIDQFLDEGVMLLEEAITPAKPAPKKNKKTKRKKSSKEKVSKVKRKVNIATKSERNFYEGVDKFAAENKSSILPKEKIKESGFRPQPVVWESTDLPIVRNQTDDVDSGSRSVHSSDLSFLADEDNDLKDNNSALETIPSDSKAKFIIVNKNKLKQLRDLRKAEDNSGWRDAEPVQLNRKSERRRNDDVEHRRRNEEPVLDLRDKLRRKGLHRSVPLEALMPNTTFNGSGASENGRSNIQVNKGNKIFIKPSLVYGNHDSSSPGFNTASTAVEYFSGFSVAREHEENSFQSTTETSPSEETVNELETTSKRKRRNVVQFKPNISVDEKKKELEIIQKQVENRTEEADLSSDFSEDFDNFELDEPEDIKPEKTARIHSTDNNDVGESPVSDGRRFISTVRLVGRRNKHKLDSTADESVSKKTRTIMREVSADPIASKRGRTGTRSKAVLASVANDDETDQRSFQRNRRDFMSDDRTITSLHSRLLRRSSRDDRPTNDRFSSSRDKVFRARSTRVDDANRNSADESVGALSNNRSVKERLGFSRNTSPFEERKTDLSNPSRNEKRKRDDDALRAEREKDVDARIRRRAEREKDVDARIRRIHEQNNKILKRRQLIEMEEKKFQLKVT